MQIQPPSGVQYAFDANQLDPTKSARMKKIAIGLVAVVVLLTLGIFFALVRSRIAPNQTPTDSQNQQIDDAQSPGAADTILNTDDLQKNKEYLQKQYQKDGKKPPVDYQYDFQFKLDPALQSAGFHIIPQAYAQSACDTANAPVALDMFILKSRYKEADAQKLADLFTLAGPPATLSSGTAFPLYFFNDVQTSSYLSVMSGSGAYAYRIPIVASTNATQDALQRTADLTMQDYVYGLQYNDPNDFTAAGSRKDGTDTVFTYTKKWDGLPVVDEATVLATKGSICNIPSTTLANSVEVVVAADARLTKMNYQMRTVKIITPVTRIDPQEALTQYGSKPPVDPIVDPPGKVVRGTPTITEIKLVYYEYGLETPEDAYVPFYLTKSTMTATDGTPVTIYALFPVMTKYAMSQAGLVIAKATNAANTTVGHSSTQQQGTFSVQPLEPTASPHSPKVVDGAQCPGSQISYSPMSCKSETGATICSATILSLADSPDPLKVCENGTCQTKQKTVAYTPGSNPCQAFLTELGVSLGSKASEITNIPPTKSGTANCYVNACPL